MQAKIVKIGCLLSFVSIHCSYAQSTDIAVVPIIPSAMPIKKNDISFIPSSYNQLFLLVYLNHTDTTKVTPFYQDPQGRLFIYPKDLKNLRIKLPNQTNDLISLDSLKEISYRYDEARQEIALQVPNNHLEHYAINLNDQEAIDYDALKSNALTAGILNYSIYGSNTNGNNNIAGDIEALWGSRWGNLTSGFIFNNDNSNRSKPIVRLQSNWQYIDPKNIRSYTLGDFISNTSEWGNSVRLAGLQWSSAYTQRPDIVTAALPQLSGSAALPSSLDLFVNQQKIYSGDVPSGPFDIKSLPLISGNEVTLVTKDATGQQVQTTQHYYYSPKLLQKGINEFSVDVGIPRYNYGVESNHYDHDTLFGATSIRHGLSNTFTASANIESSTDGLKNVGAGFAKNLANRGVVNMDLALSDYKDQHGALSLIGVEGNLSDTFSINASYQRIFNNYYDLARVSNLRFDKQQDTPKNDVNYLSYSALADEIIRAGINWNFIPRYMLSLNYNKIKYFNNDIESASINLGGSLSKRLSFYTSFFQDLYDRHNYGGYLTLQYQPKQQYVMSASYADNSGETTYRQNIVKSASGIGSVGWGASIAHNESDTQGAVDGTAYVNYRAHPADFTAQYSHFGDNDQTIVSARGALVATAGRVFAANQIGNAYALIENAGSGSHILNGGVDLGVTDRQGRFFISDLVPYSKQHIYLDPTYLGLDWQPTHTEQIAVTGYRQGTRIDFGTHKSLSATVTILDKDHQIIAPGYSVTVNGKKDAAVVGYDGEIYVADIKPQNELTIDLLDKSNCTVNFTYQKTTSATTTLGPFLCQ